VGQVGRQTGTLKEDLSANQIFYGFEGIVAVWGMQKQEAGQQTAYQKGRVTV